MSFFQPDLHTSLTSSFDERQWVTLIRRTLREELEEDIETSITIFAVPKALMLTDPDSYIPHQIAIGPYHHLRPELYDMESYKLFAAKRFHKQLGNSIKFEHLVELLMQHELWIRACYHRPIAFGGQTLAWMMAVDTAFLFEFLQVCGVKEGKVLTRVPSTMAHLVDLSGNKTAHNAILRDIMMLENQIPLFVVRMILEFKLLSGEKADESLHDMLNGVCKELSPFMTVEGSSKIEVRDCAHFLDFLYQFIVPKIKVVAAESFVEIYEEEGEAQEAKEHSFMKISQMRDVFVGIWKVLVKLDKRPVEWIKRTIFSESIKELAKYPCSIVKKIPLIDKLREPLEFVFNAFDQDTEPETETIYESSLKGNCSKHPVLEEISIPSVTQLVEVGVQFLPTYEGITTIKLDAKTRKFHIPVINLDFNSEVVLRNLVAYEACSGSGPLVLSRYTELMNGIIDTDEDARFLCQKGIIINHLKSEKEVADLWNGMSKSIRLTKVPSLDKVIRDVNKYYKGRWKVKLEIFMKTYVFGSWKILTLVATVVLILLMSSQAICEIFSCGRILHPSGFEPGDD